VIFFDKVLLPLVVNSPWLPAVGLAQPVFENAMVSFYAVRLQVDNYVKGLIHDMIDTKRKKDFAAYWESMKGGQPIYTDAVKDTIVRQYERKEKICIY
jgi:hypothetical protein